MDTNNGLPGESKQCLAVEILRPDADNRLCNLAVSIDEKRSRNRPRISERVFEIVVRDDIDIRNAMFLHECGNQIYSIGRSIGCDTEDLDVLGCKLAAECDEIGKFSLARATPRCPEVDEGDITMKGIEVDRLPGVVFP